MIEKGKVQHEFFSIGKSATTAFIVWHAWQWAELKPRSNEESMARQLADAQ
jgi:hypothetical protein